MYLPVQISFTIGTGQSQSAPGFVYGMKLLDVFVPSNWPASASMSFLASRDNVSYQPLYEPNGSEIVIPVVPNTWVRLVGPFGDGVACGFRFLKIRSGTSASPVTVTANVTVHLFARQEL